MATVNGEIERIAVAEGLAAGFVETRLRIPRLKNANHPERPCLEGRHLAHCIAAGKSFRGKRALSTTTLLWSASSFTVQGAPLGEWTWNMAKKSR